MAPFTSLGLCILQKVALSARYIRCSWLPYLPRGHWWCLPHRYSLRGLSSADSDNMIWRSSPELRKDRLLLPALLVHWEEICPLILDVFWAFSLEFLWNFKQKHENHSPQRVWIPEASCLYSVLRAIPCVTVSPTTCLPLALLHCTIGHLSVCGKRGIDGMKFLEMSACVCARVPLSLPLFTCTPLSYRDLAFCLTGWSVYLLLLFLPWTSPGLCLVNIPFRVSNY